MTFLNLNNNRTYLICSVLFQLSVIQPRVIHSLNTNLMRLNILYFFIILKPTHSIVFLQFRIIIPTIHKWYTTKYVSLNVNICKLLNDIFNILYHELYRQNAIRYIQSHRILQRIMIVILSAQFTQQVLTVLVYEWNKEIMAFAPTITGF